MNEPFPYPDGPEPAPPVGPTVTSIPISELAPEIQAAYESANNERMNFMATRLERSEEAIQADDETEAYGLINYEMGFPFPTFILTWLNDTNVDTEALDEPIDEEQLRIANSKSIAVWVNDDNPLGYRFALSVGEADELSQTLRTFVALMRDPDRGRNPGE